MTSWKNIQGCLGWLSTANHFCRNSGALSAIAFGLEAVREWTFLVVLTSIAQPWLLLVFGFFSAIGGLVRWMQDFRQHPVSIAEEINAISPQLAEAGHLPA